MRSKKIQRTQKGIDKEKGRKRECGTVKGTEEEFVFTLSSLLHRSVYSGWSPSSQKENKTIKNIVCQWTLPPPTDAVSLQEK